MANTFNAGGLAFPTYEAMREYFDNPPGYVPGGGPSGQRIEVSLGGDPSAPGNVIGKPPALSWDPDGVLRGEGPGDGSVPNRQPASGGGGKPSGTNQSNPVGWGVPDASGSYRNSYNPTPSYGGGGGQYSIGGGSTASGGQQQQRQQPQQQQQPQRQQGMSTGTVFTGNQTGLDPRIWNKPITPADYSGSSGAFGAAQTAADRLLHDVNPQPGQMDRQQYDQYTQFTGAGPERSIYNQYSKMLTDPTAFMSNPVVAAAIAAAQKGAGRQLAASRISKSGNAAQAISDTTAQTALGQYYNMANTLRGGAETEMGRYTGQAGVLGGAASQEAGRWGTMTDANLKADQIRAQAWGDAGKLGVTAADINSRMGDAQGKLDLAEKKLELDRVNSGQMTAEERYAAAKSTYDKFDPYAGIPVRGMFDEANRSPMVQAGLNMQASLNPGSYQDWVNKMWGQR